MTRNHTEKHPVDRDQCRTLWAGFADDGPPLSGEQATLVNPLTNDAPVV